MKKCPLCSRKRIKEVFSRQKQGFSSFYPFAEEIPVVNVSLQICNDCNYVFIVDDFEHKYGKKFLKNVYSNYNLMDIEGKRFPNANEYRKAALDYLINNLNFDEINTVLEVGSNRGDFSGLLKKNYPHLNVIGLDPVKLNYYGIPTVNSFFKPYLFGNKFDLIIMRHVLEHIDKPTSFIKKILNNLHNDGYLFLEVPNFLSDIEDKIEPFIAEHRGYYTTSSILKLLTICSLAPTSFRNSNPNGLFVICKPLSHNRNDTDVIATSQFNICRNDILNQIENFKKSIANILSTIEKHLINGDKLVLYGFGNVFQCVWSELSLGLHIDRLKKQIVIVDDSEYKIGKVFKGIKIDKSDILLNMDLTNLLILICSMNREGIKNIVNKLISIGIPKDKIFMAWSKI